MQREGGAREQSGSECQEMPMARQTKVATLPDREVSGASTPSMPHLPAPEGVSVRTNIC